MNIVGNIGNGTNFSLGQRIKRAPEKRGWTLELLASKLGVSKVTAWSWECDRTKPRLDRAIQLSELLGIEDAARWLGEDALGQPVAEVVAESQKRIANAAGVAVDAVEIRITFRRDS